MSNLSGKALTVLGPVDPSDLGITWTHEHLSLTFEVSFLPTANPEEKYREQLPWSMSNLGWIRQNPYNHWPNLRLHDEHEAVLEEMKLFRSLGGRTVVENTSIGIHRDVRFLKQLAEDAHINIVAGTGYYVAASHPADMSTRSVESLADVMRHDIETGADGSDIRCGVIGEIGCSWPLHDNERKVLRAAALVQSELGCPVIIHPGRNPIAPAEAVRILQEAGGDAGKTVMSHIDRTISNRETLLNFAELGGYCEWDLFGIEISHYSLDSGFDMPSDAQRIANIKYLIDAGFRDKIVVGHDIHTKHRLTKYGGHGYSHILINVVPKMLQRGYSQEDVDAILIENPRRWLTFK